MEAARKEYEEALKIRRRLAQNKPDTHLPDVALTLNNLANFDRDQNRMEPARKEIEEALEIFQQFAARNPDRFQADLMRAKKGLESIGR